MLMKFIGCFVLTPPQDRTNGKAYGHANRHAYGQA